MATKTKTPEVLEHTNGKEEQNPLLDAVRKVLLAGIGAFALGKEEIEDFVDKLIERGEIAEKDGLKGLEELPGIGKSLASTIREYVATGRLAMLDRLEGEVAPEDLIATVPGIGEQLAKRIHDHLGVETLEDLELAASDAD